MPDPSVRIALGGGGGSADERQVLEVFAGWIDGGGVLYVPIAMEPPFDHAYDWAIATLGSVGITNVMLASSPELVLDGLPRCDGVFIGGGNTYSLMHALRAAGVDHALRRLGEEGLPIYGGSAGALILGRDIDTAKHFDSNDVGLARTTGLDLVRGYAVWCHYTPNMDPLIRDHVRGSAVPVLALPERGGAIRVSEEIRVVGPDRARIFHTGTSRTLEPNDPVPALA